MDKIFKPKESEKKWQKFWIDKKIYKFDPRSKKPIFSCDTPPPTVSGVMHMGHALAYSQADFIMRFQRMQGNNIFYPWGFDDNGLATERFVEKKIGKRSRDMPRSKFVKICLKETQQAEKELQQAWASLGISPDWSINYRTIDNWCQRVSQLSFLELYKMGREYRKEAPTIWCPECQTAIAQVELEDKELSSQFNTVIFKVEGKNLEIATTRPELLPACVAVFVHPEDERYKHLVGKKALVPLFNFEVPILEDDKVETEKGTGAVMCCCFGDIFDVEWWYKHKLPLKIVITKDGKMAALAREYKGLTIKQARKKIIQDLKNLGLLTEQKSIQHTLNVHERCGTEVEFLVTKQWFIKYLDLKKQFLEAGNKLNWHPKYMKIRYDNWIKGLQWDWCISRQRYYGIPFPVWYCKDCDEIILADEKDLPVDPLENKPKKPCPKCGSKEFIPEKDVLDTWATSSLTPMIATKWKKDNKFFKKINPMSLRSNGHDIITFWLFNTVVKSLLHEKQIPWKDIMVNGFVLDPKGRKMSKSKGNVIDPLDIIKLYGSDALRFWAASAKLGSDIPFKEKEITAGQRFITKLWNASRFASMHLKDFKTKPKKLEPMDIYLLSKLQTIINNSTKSFLEYEYSKTKFDVENFFWHTFCDNYLEIIKDRLYNPDKRGKEARQSAQYVLYTTLLTVLKLMAPITPHITEEIYQLYFQKREKAKSIHLSDWPKVDNNLIDKKLEVKGDEVVDIISKVRQFKQKHQKSLKTPVKITLLKNQISELFLEDLKAATNAEIKFGRKFNIKF